MEETSRKALSNNFLKSAEVVTDEHGDGEGVRGEGATEGNTLSGGGAMYEPLMPESLNKDSTLVFSKASLRSSNPGRSSRSLPEDSINRLTAFPVDKIFLASFIGINSGNILSLIVYFSCQMRSMPVP